MDKSMVRIMGVLLPLWCSSLSCCLLMTTVHASKCTEKPIYYASECLSMEECGWCCERPVGFQCFDKLIINRTSYTCSEDAILDNVNMTCAHLCTAPVGACKVCEKRNWCYYCISSSTCQPPYATCTKGEVIQLCSMMENGSGSGMDYFKYIILVGCWLIGLALIASLALFVHLRCQARRAEQRLADESVPFLNSNTSAQQRHDDTNNRENFSGGAVPEREGGMNGTDAALLASVVAGAAVVGETAITTGEQENVNMHPTLRSAQLSTADDDSPCFLCFESSPVVTFLPCYHTCCCERCSNKLRPTGGDALTCPFCRTKIEAMVSLRSVLLQASSNF